MSRPNFNRDNNNSRSSFASSGLATNLPPASDVGRRAADGEGAWRGATDTSDNAGSGKYRAPRTESTWGAATTTYARRQQRQDEPDQLDDKWSRAFSKSSQPEPVARDQAPPARELAINSRAGGFGRSADEPRSERPQRTFADRMGAREGEDRPPREGRDFGDRPPREGRDFGDRPPREGRDFGDRPPREGRDFGDRPPREGRDFGDRPPREGRDFGDRPPREGGRGFGERRDYEGGRRNFGEGDARRQYNGEGRGGGRRDNNREWESDPRFAGKFGRDLNPRFNNDREKPSIDAPLPTAPKASLDAGKTIPPPAAIPILVKEKVVAPKPAKNDKKDEEAEKRAEKKKAEEEARRARFEAEEAARQEQANALSSSYAAVADGIKAGLKGTQLTSTAKNTAGGSLVAAGALKAVLSSLEDYTLKWYSPDQYGDVVKSSFNGTDDEQVTLLYVVQEYCATKKFPKVDIKGTQKKLIELLFTHLLAGDFVDVEAIIAWADDSTDNDYKGRTDAIVQTNGMIATLRASLQEEESEVDSDEDFDAPQAHLK